MPPDTKQADPRTTGDRPNASTPSSANDETIVTGRLVRRRDNHWDLIVERCPFCRRRHVHGAPYGEHTREEVRVSHCRDGSRLPYRVVAEAA